MINFKHSTFIVLIALAITSCKQEDSNLIYLCGNTPEHRAFYYSNGTQKILSPESYPSSAYAMQVIDSTVYCVGNRVPEDGKKSVGTLWKNGKAFDVTDGTNDVMLTDLHITQNGIYCIGSEADGKTYKTKNDSYAKRSRAKVWIIRDGAVVKTTALTDGKNDALAKSIYVDNNENIHIAGYDNGKKLYLRSDYHSDSRYWVVDGDSGKLLKTEQPFKTSGICTTIWGDDDEIMLGGYIDDDLDSSGGWKALYWKDGWGRNLESVDFETIITDGCFSGNDWYMCGHSRNSNALYYMNGRLMFLNEPKSGGQAKASSITVVNNDIYIAGFLKQSEESVYMNGYWKNGSFVPIEGLFGTPHDIVVIPTTAQASESDSTKTKEEKKEIIHICGLNQLQALPDRSGYNLYSLRLNEDNKNVFAKVNDVVFSGKFERLNIQEIKGSGNMLILYSQHGKYLWNINEGRFMLDGNSFEKLEKDNAGGLCIQTKDGIYHIAGVEGLPGKVEKYFRSGTFHDMFLYKTNGKWGAYCKLAKHGWRNQNKEKYVEILPPIYDRIRYVIGDGANHFVCKKNGAWEMRDAYGRKRRMTLGYGTWELNHSSMFSRQTDATSTYTSKINSITPGIQDKYNTFFKTRCTCTGDKEASIILLEAHEDSWSSIFDGDDKSREYLPWDEIDNEKWEYNYIL